MAYREVQITDSKGNMLTNLYAGPYRENPGDPAFGVKLAKEIDAPCNMSLPIPDFSVPKLQDAHWAIARMAWQIASGQPVYVGCMAGRGRTGLFLALFAKAYDASETPVEYIRTIYNPHAVETQEQYDFVTAYEPDLPTRIAMRAVKATGKLQKLFDL